MPTRKFRIVMALTSVVVTVAAGCGDPVSYEFSEAPGITAARFSAMPARPFRGRITGVLTAVAPFAPGSHDICNANFTGDPAAPGAAVSVFDDARGNFSHLGRIELHAVSCLDPASPFSSGFGTITAANGDQLFINFENLTVPDAADPSRLRVSGSQTVTGGTGRLRDAHGDQACTFTIVLLSASTGNIEGACEGQLTY